MWRSLESPRGFPSRNVYTWNALISGYTQKGLGREALGCFCGMRKAGLSPDAITYACTLKACGITKEVDFGGHIHDEIVSQGLFGHVMLGNALIDMYAKCGVLNKAHDVLDELPIRDVVSWTALIAGYIQQAQSKNAIVCYDRMKDEGISPDAVTYACMLKACGIAKEIDKGEQIHEEIASRGLLGKDVVLGNALVDMYAKCGMPNKARRVLEELPIRNVISWSALLAGYEQEGWGKEANDCFKRMQSDGITPNTVSWNTLIEGYAQQGESQKALGYLHRMQHQGTPVDATTLVCVLNACSHSGLVDEGQVLFDNMEERFGITPNMEHHVCMVDLCGRAGQFHKAMAVIEKLPPSHYLGVWLALLGACRKWGNVQLGRLAFEHVILINECEGAAYAGMENIYAAASIWGEEA